MPPARALAGPLAADAVVELETDAGPLLIQRSSTILAPLIDEYGFWEPQIGAVLRRNLRPGMTFVDVGANVGYFSALASPLVGPTGRVIAIEADPANVEVLRANTRRAGRENMEVLPVAAWSERGHLNLHLSPDGGASSHVGSHPGGGLRVPCAPLDELLPEHVDVIKVDCELTDHVVVRGAIETLAANPRLVLIVEFIPDFTGHTGESSAEILAFYAQLGLDIKLLELDGSEAALSSAEIRASTRTHVDLVLRPA